MKTKYCNPDIKSYWNKNYSCEVYWACCENCGRDIGQFKSPEKAIERYHENYGKKGKTKCKSMVRETNSEA